MNRARSKYNAVLSAVFLAFIAGGMALAQDVEARKLKVYILAGQSNMEGHAKTETLDYLRDTHAAGKNYDTFIHKDGTPRAANHVWISYLTGSGDQLGEGHGKLTAGYGSRRVPQESNGKIGPEFSFGLRMEQSQEQPILVIKTAWGGKSLFHDFRPPSAGIYPRSELDQERERYLEADSGKYYRLMINHVRSILADPKRVCPAYDEAAGLELAGFVWFQGWNDMVNHDVYPRLSADSKANEYAEYGSLLSHFIRDVRTDLNAPQLPFVIGVMGVGGYQTEERYRKQHNDFRDSMAYPATLSEFENSVFAVRTADFWDEQLGDIDRRRQQVGGKRSQLRKLVESGELTQAEMDQSLTEFESSLISIEEKTLFERGASNAAYHYLGCGKIMVDIGDAFARAFLPTAVAQ